jgi:hypothetical protein
MSVPFRQYQRPNARKREVEIEMLPEVEALALKFIQGGGRFECEQAPNRSGEFYRSA